jgi:5-methylcytosine-specific restriction endonuclease McrA
MSELLGTIERMGEIIALNIADDGRAASPAGRGPEAGSADGAGPDPDGPLVSLERLEERICELAAHLAAGTCRFLQLVAEFDARRGWACWDLPSCAAWLAWKCQVAPGTAREQVRVARALGGLPVICAEFAAGRMSYAKARALTRIATAATEAGLAEITGPMTAAQCERFVAAHRKASDEEELASWAARRVSVHVAEDGSVAISARLPAADGAVVLQALRAAAGDCEHPHRPHREPAEDAGPAQDARPGAGGVPAGTRRGATASGDPGDGDPARPGTAACRASLADALVQVAGAYLSQKIATAGDPDIYQVIVHAGPEALMASGPAADDPARTSPAGQRGVSAETSGDQHRACAETRPDEPPAAARVPAKTPGNQPADTAARPGDRPAGHPAHPRRCHLDDGPALSPAAAQALACHATVSWMLHDHDGTLLDAGRRHRKPPPALRRAVRERDKGRCQFPGCHSRRTDIHHIPWGKGGKTRLRDLILLCEPHHVIVHALGWVITPARNGAFAFTRPDGQPMPSNPGLPGSDGDLSRCHDADITTDTIIPAGLGDQLDLDLAVWACFANARITAERADEDQHEHDLAA